MWLRSWVSVNVFPLSHVDHVANDLLSVVLPKRPQGYKQRIVMLPWGIVVYIV